MSHHPHPAEHPCTEHADEPRRYLQIFQITLVICAIQVAGGLLSGSLALLSDSVHAATDGASALISYWVARTVLQSKLSREAEAAKRRLWMRVSGLILLGSLVWIGKESFERYQDPTVVIGWAVMIVAGIGAALNVWQHRLVPHNHTSTAHMQRLHVMGDLYSSIAVVIAGALIWATGWHLVDPVLSSLLILFIGKSTVQMMLSEEIER